MRERAGISQFEVEIHSSLSAAMTSQPQLLFSGKLGIAQATSLPNPRELRLANDFDPR